MLSILIACLVAVGVLVTGLALFDAISGFILGPILGAVALVLLLRRGRRKVEAGIKDVEGHVKGQRFDKAIASPEALKPLGRWQPGLGGSLDAQIGMLKYAHQRDFEGSRPHLESAHPKIWQALAMLAASHFKKERFEEMRQVFERAVKKNKDASLLWLAYAWCEWKRGRKEEAMQVLIRAQKACPKDERIKNQLHNLQNGKKLKMSQHDPEWLALHLERTLPANAAQAARPRFLPPARKLGVRYVRG
jgi:tetratricopeptide (TPR) repeat protein